MAVVKRPSGNYAIIYRVNGRQVWETIGPSKREAERAERERRRAAFRGEWLAPSRLTLDQYGREWLSLRDPGRVAANGRRMARPRRAGDPTGARRRDPRRADGAGQARSAEGRRAGPFLRAPLRRGARDRPPARRAARASLG
jgi:hypothetical protein